MNQDKDTAKYGCSLESPIHVSGFYEERIYLEHLHRTGEREPVSFRRLGSNLSRTTKHPIDLYEIAPSRFAGRPSVIYIDLYGESDWRAPEGFTLDCDRPAREDGEPERQLGDELDHLIRQLTSKLT